PYAADLVRWLAALDAALRDRRMPVRQAVEIPQPRPDAVIAGIDDGGYVNLGHLPPQLFSPSPRAAGGGGFASGLPSPLSRDASLIPCMSRASRMSPGIFARLPPSTPMSERIESISGACTRYRSAESMTSSVALRPAPPPWPLPERPSTWRM